MVRASLLVFFNEGAAALDSMGVDEDVRLRAPPLSLHTRLSRHTGSNTCCIQVVFNDHAARSAHESDRVALGEAPQRILFRFARVRASDCLYVSQHVLQLCMMR